MKRENLKKEFEAGEVVITKDNIHLYYEFLKIKDMRRFRNIISPILHDRLALIVDALNIPRDYISLSSLGIWHSFFNIRDTLKPIDDYIEDIKESSEYKEYISKSIFKKGDKIICTKELKTTCNNEQKILFKLNKIYHVDLNSTGNIGIKIDDKGNGFTFFDNKYDKYFKKI
ncbi:hypothetical protein [Brevundimonas sp. FT23042]|uniref:hypothetical protein n=1 Tax=Brevundimonas sp. FT23042 TaxID=3393749 RepID=UPI003B586DF3